MNAEPHHSHLTPVAAPEAGHEQHRAPVADGHRAHGGTHGAGRHAGHHTEAFRRRFWWCLLLTVPVVVTSEMVMDWFGYELDFAGIEWVGPVLGSVIFFWGGWPFLEGGWRELKQRQPGMMLLIAMAISVAYVASMATFLDWFDLDFWWELAALVTIMLLGHWQEMRALGQSQDALAALAALLPDEAERVGPDQSVEVVPIDQLRPGDVVLVRSGARVPADGTIIEGSAELDESMITGESKPVSKDAGDRVVAGTVQRVHDLGVVHRNLHPSNVLVSRDGVPKLIGFGMVGLLAGADPRVVGNPGVPDEVDVRPAEVDVRGLQQLLGWLGLALRQPLPPRLEALRQPGSVASPGAFAEEVRRSLE